MYLFVPRGGQPAPITLPAVVTPRVIASGQMEIALQHSLESGFIKVWIADDPVLERPIEGRVVKKVLNFRQYKGSFNETVSIPPGRPFHPRPGDGRRLQRLQENPRGVRERPHPAAAGQRDRLAQARAGAFLGLVTAKAVVLRDVKKRYPGGATALLRVSLEVDAGTVLVLLGTSGSGKTTALKTINRLVRPDAGQVRLARRGRARGPTPSPCAAGSAT